MIEKKRILNKINKYFSKYNNYIDIVIGFYNLTYDKIKCIQKTIQLNKYIKITLIYNKIEKYLIELEYFYCNQIKIIQSNHPESTMFDFMNDSKYTKIIIRGELKSSILLNIMKNKLNNNSYYRIATIITKKKLLLIAPVGIDEGESIKEKVNFMIYGLKLLRKLNIKPKIGMFDNFTYKIIKKYKIIHNKINLKYNIKIFNKIIPAQCSSNYLIFSNGITGNLCFRTMTHLCNLDGMGAPMFFDIKYKNTIFIDTSRTLNHYLNSIKLSIYLLR